MSVSETSEQVEVSANKLQVLIANQLEYKEQCTKEMTKLRGQLKAKDEQLRLYNDAINKLKMMKMQKSSHTNGVGTKRVMDEMSKSRQFDKWFEENKNALVEKEYDEHYKSEVEELRSKLNSLLQN